MTDLRTAAQQALEALEALDAPPSGVVDHYELDRRKQALRAALAQQEQATVKESLPVGQEEPEGGWQSAPSPQVTQRIADMPMSEYRRGVNDGFKLGLREGRIKAEDEMREQPEQEPVAWTDRELQLIDGMIEVQLHHAAQCDGIANRTMAERQKGWDMERVALLRKIKSISPRRETEQEQAEPVAYSVQSPDDAKRNRITPSLVTDTRLELEQYLGNSETAKHIVPLYTHPPRREWRSLSEEEIHDCFQQRHKDKATERRMIARAVEQALRSRSQ